MFFFHFFRGDHFKVIPSAYLRIGAESNQRKPDLFVGSAEGVVDVVRLVGPEIAEAQPLAAVPQALRDVAAEDQSGDGDTYWFSLLKRRTPPDPPR